MDWIPLNWNIIKHPVNWFTVVLMLWIAILAFHELSEFTGITQETD